MYSYMRIYEVIWGSDITQEIAIHFIKEQWTAHICIYIIFSYIQLIKICIELVTCNFKCSSFKISFQIPNVYFSKVCYHRTRLSSITLSPTEATCVVTQVWNPSREEARRWGSVWYTGSEWFRTLAMEWDTLGLRSCSTTYWCWRTLGKESDLLKPRRFLSAKKY